MTYVSSVALSQRGQTANVFGRRVCLYASVGARAFTLSSSNYLAGKKANLIRRAGVTSTSTRLQKSLYALPTNSLQANYVLSYKLLRILPKKRLTMTMTKRQQFKLVFVGQMSTDYALQV